MNDESLQSTAAMMPIVAAAALLILRIGKRCVFHSSSTDPVASSSKSKSASRTNNATSTETPFDKLADVYDSSFCDTTVGRLLRRQTWEHFDEAFATSNFKSTQTAPILEIGCGTGDDALHLASKYVYVLATDYSQGMLRKARQKCYLNATVPRECQPTFKKLDLRDSHYDVSLEPIHKFAGAYCNFGGLNNLSPEDIGHLAHELSELIHPGGKVVLVVMGRFCLFETLYYLLTSNFKRAFRRLKRARNAESVARVAPNTKKQTIYFYSPYFIEKTFADTSQFQVIRKRAIGLTLPPSLWSRSSSKNMHPSLLSFLSWSDSMLSGHWPFFYLGDHFLIEFEHL
eukprot:scaffold29727_cov131-Skeletonema_menzelii.AAC.2